MATYHIKRIYDEPADSDGFRILVDRLWPRGISKEKAALGVWLKEVGPSSELRQWFGHVPERFAEFRTRYRRELSANPATNELKDLAKDHPVITLVYSAHDTEHNQAKVLAEYLEQ